MTDSHIADRDLTQVANTAVSAAQLPAVPVPDWCLLAAQTITASSPDMACRVTIAQLDGDGNYRNVEMTGLSFGANLSAQVAQRADRIGPRIGDPIVWEHALPEACEASAARLNGSAGDRGWRNTPTGQRWTRLGTEAVTVGLCALGNNEHRRYLIVEIACICDHCEPSDGFSTEVLRSLMPLFAERAIMALGTTPTVKTDRLTRKEQQVLDNLVLGSSVREIATALGRSPHTIHDHVKSMHRKLGASSRGELVARALGRLVVTDINDSNEGGCGSGCGCAPGARGAVVASSRPGEPLLVN